MSRILLLPILSALAAVSALPAQGPRVIGLTNMTPILSTQDTQTCQWQQCMPPVGPAPAPFAGGTAHDATDGGTWVTDGLVLAKVDSRNQCNVICPPQPVPFLAAGVFATGLAYDEQTGQLFMTLSNNIVHTFQVQGCALNLVARCIFPLPQGHVLTGIATDDVNGLVYVASSPLLGPSPIPNGIVFQAPQTAPCAPICRYQIPDCAGALMPQITGVAFDPCRGVVYATDGGHVTGAAILPNCQIQIVSCCPPVLPERYVGLALIPIPPRPSGASCTGNPCPSCPALQHVATGDPAIGNPAFSLDLINAPANSSAFLLLNVGNCQPTGPSYFFCGPILVGPGPLGLGAFSTGPGAGCTGGVSYALPLPLNPVLCGIPFATQYVGICPSTPTFGTFVSNCLDWTIQGS